MIARGPRRTAGFTLVEVLAALVILTLVILTSLAVFADRARRLTEAGEMALAWQALGNEAEARRRDAFETFAPGTTLPFVTDVAAGGLPDATGEIAVAEAGPNLRALELRVAWRGGAKRAAVTVYRASTGGGALW